MNRNVWLLFSCQALMNAVMAGQVIMASVIGHKLSGGTSLNTLPMAIQQIGVMLASIPAGIVFARYGRKAGFWMGCGIAMFGSVTFAFGVYTENFVIYCFGALPAGIGFGISQHLRFAAAEVASTEARPRAISLVLAGGVLAAIVGPEMVKRTHDLIPDYVFLATYLWLPFLPIVTVVLLYFVQLPPAPPKLVSPVKFATIFARPTFITALIASLVGYGTMNLVMASTPLQMLLCGFGINESADVIRAHSVAMFLPGFITGRLIQKFGVHQIITAGMGFSNSASLFTNGNSHFYISAGAHKSNAIQLDEDKVRYAKWAGALNVTAVDHLPIGKNLNIDFGLNATVSNFIWADAQVGISGVL